MSKFFAILTHAGADKIANATVLGTQIKITQMAVGDGNGTLPVPDPAQTKLVHEVRRGAINQLSADEKNTNQIIAEQVIPENEGGWWIREIGLYDENGILIAVGNCPETYKPQLQEGSGRTQTLRMILVVSSTEAVTLKVDPSVVLATKSYVIELVDKKLKEHEQSRNHPSATLKEKGLVQLSSELDSTSETEAATPKAVKTAAELAKSASEKADKKLDKENVKHSVGSSTTDVMSQKASTNAFQPKGNYQDSGYSYSKSESDGKYQPKGNYGEKNTASKSDHGWWKCASTGMIIQWGRGTNVRTFPIAFPTKVCSITASLNETGGDNEAGARISAVSRTSFKVTNGKQKNNCTYYWQAVGF